MRECNVTRLLDVCFSFIAIFFLLPLFIPVVLLLRITGEGEVFYVQQRVGYRGSCFGLIKFATMLKASPNLGSGTITVKGDPRVLPVGKFLRLTKINELPQLLNVLRGDMSLIGPRPLTPENYAMYPAHIRDVIQLCRPGLSGVGSIVFRDEQNLLNAGQDPVQVYRNIIAPFKGQLEEWYVNNRSIYSYFLLIFLTIWVVVTRKSNILWLIFPNLPRSTELNLPESK